MMKLVWEQEPIKSVIKLFDCTVQSVETLQESQIKMEDQNMQEISQNSILDRDIQDMV